MLCYFRMKQKERLKAFRNSIRTKRLRDATKNDNHGIGLYANIDGFSEIKRMELQDIFER